MQVFFPGGKKVAAQYNGLIINTDQSREEGGEGSAPEPFALFLASLATCTGIYALAFCEARQIDTTGLGLSLKTVSGPEGKGLARVEMELALPPDFPPKYEKAILRVAGGCAVKKAIMNPPELVLTARPA